MIDPYYMPPQLCRHARDADSCTECWSGRGRAELIDLTMRDRSCLRHQEDEDADSMLKGKMPDGKEET